MDKNQKAFVSIYCKIYTDTFSDEMIDRLADGTEIYDFLMEDACQCLDDNDHLILGDINLWYLATAEKFGTIALEDKVWKWGFGGSSFNIVEAFIKEINSIGLFTEQQYRTLLDKIAEARQIDNMYDICAYLVSKRNQIVWNKKPDAGKFREDIKRRVGGVEKSFKDNEYQFFI